jgi:hypothetical protein
MPMAVQEEDLVRAFSALDTAAQRRVRARINLMTAQQSDPFDYAAWWRALYEISFTGTSPKTSAEMISEMWDEATG